MQNSFVKNLVWIVLPPVLAVAVAAVMTGCAPREEFQVVPHQGAAHTGIYPRFSDRPQAETGQFSTEEKARLTEELDGDAQHVRGISSYRVKSGRSRAAQREDARREAEETLKQIEKTGGQMEKTGADSKNGQP